MQDTQELNLTELTRIIKKRKATFFKLFAVVFFSASIVSFLIPPVYKANAKVIIQNDTNLYPPSVFPVTTDDKAYLNTQKEIMTSSFVVNKALASLSDRRFFKDADYDKFKKHIVVNYLQDSNMLEVNVYLRDPGEAVKLANAMVDEFINYNANARQELVEQNLLALKKETAALNKDIEDLKTRLREFSDKEGMVFYQAKVPSYLNNILELERKNTLVDADIDRIEQQVSKNNKVSGGIETEAFYPLLLASSGGQNIENPTESLTSIPWMRDMKKKLSEAQANLARLEVEYTEGHPAIQVARSEIVNLRQSLDKELKNVLKIYSEHYKGYVQFLKTLRSSNEREKERYEAELENISSNINKAANKQIEYNALLKNFDIMQDIYAVFAKKQNELKFLWEQSSNNAVVPNLRVFEQASLPRKPVSPNLPLNLALGFCFGIFIGVSGSMLEERNELLAPAEKPMPARANQKRRSMNRQKRKFSVAYEVKGGASLKQRATTEDLSGTGMNIKAKENLARNSELSLWIQMNQNEFISATGEVVWAVPSKAEKAFNAGVRFTSIDSQDREKLINYLYGEQYLEQNA